MVNAAAAGALAGQRVGRYHVLALLAMGGTAEIYLARIVGTSGFEKFVVFKVLHGHLADDQDYIKMFLDEARLAAQLDHSNIVQTLELGEHNGRYYMVLEFLPGLSLAMMLRRLALRKPGQVIPVGVALGFVSQACAGLHYAHERAPGGVPLGIVHRDISPQNLVVNFEGVVKLVDFGIARAEHRESRTRAGTVKGKFAYMSPEQCLSSRVDRRTDVFALGIVLYELLTGQRLFKRSTPYDTYQAVLECKVPAPSTQVRGLTTDVDPIVLKALYKDPSDRYQTAEEFSDVILDYMHARGLSTGAQVGAAFLSTAFAPEIEEYSVRMRELLDGRNIDTGDTWSEGADPEGEIDTGVRSRPDAASAMPPPSREDGAERTRIQVNPLHEERHHHRPLTPDVVPTIVPLSPSPPLLATQVGIPPDMVSPPAASSTHTESTQPAVPRLPVQAATIVEQSYVAPELVQTKLEPMPSRAADEPTALLPVMPAAQARPSSASRPPRREPARPTASPSAAPRNRTTTSGAEVPPRFPASSTPPPATPTRPPEIAATESVKAVEKSTPWILVVFFAVAIGIAFAITVIVAKLVV